MLQLGKIGKRVRIIGTTLFNVSTVMGILYAEHPRLLSSPKYHKVISLYLPVYTYPSRIL